MESISDRFPTAWLSNFGYNQAGIAFERARGKWKYLPTGEELDLVRQRLLDERFETEQALGRLGITEFCLPKDIPGAGTIINETPLPHGRPARVCVAGMPGAGKDTILGKCGDLLAPHISVQPEAYTYLKQRGLAGNSPVFTDIEEWVARETREQKSLIDGIEEVNERNTVEGFQLMSDGIVLLNRFFIDDPPWLRAFFLDGRFRGRSFIESSLSLATIALVPDATFFFMVPPEIALERKLKHNELPGKILNPEFLRILYGQYLRYYYEYLSGETNVPNLIILDMSGSIDDNFNLFIDKLEEIWGRWIF